MCLTITYKNKLCTISHFPYNLISTSALITAFVFQKRSLLEKIVVFRTAIEEKVRETVISGDLKENISDVLSLINQFFYATSMEKGVNDSFSVLCSGFKFNKGDRIPEELADDDNEEEEDEADDDDDDDEEEDDDEDDS